MPKFFTYSLVYPAAGRPARCHPPSESAYPRSHDESVGSLFTALHTTMAKTTSSPIFLEEKQRERSCAAYSRSTSGPPTGRHPRHQPSVVRPAAVLFRLFPGIKGHLHGTQRCLDHGQCGAASCAKTPSSHPVFSTIRPRATPCIIGSKQLASRDRFVGFPTTRSRMRSTALRRATSSSSTTICSLNYRSRFYANLSIPRRTSLCHGLRRRLGMQGLHEIKRKVALDRPTRARDRAPARSFQNKYSHLNFWKNIEGSIANVINAQTSPVPRTTLKDEKKRYPKTCALPPSPLHAQAAAPRRPRVDIVPESLAAGL